MSVDANSLPGGSYASRRRRMVEEQIRRRGIHDAEVLAAMQRVPREKFVPEAVRHQAYCDWPLPIGLGQTISQPYTVAFMAASLQLRGDERVLEIGTGSGYGAAVLSQLAQVVHTVERLASLAEQARMRLAETGCTNVIVHLGDGTQGLPEHAPFDAIVVTAAARVLPEPYREQLADGGRIVIPIGGRTSQSLTRFTRHGNRMTREHLGGFAFVPLIGECGWSESAS